MKVPRVRRSGLSLAFASFLIAGSSVRAQQVTGVVTDAAGRPLAEAAVILPESQRRTRTDSLGRFALVAPASGVQILRVLLIGHRMDERRLTIADSGPTAVRIVLHRTRQMLDTVRIVDVEGCAPHTVRGFECRRAGGTAMYRDAGEIRSMRPSAWVDMLDGMPGIRRVPVMTSTGLDWRAGVEPSRCLVESFNGYPRTLDGQVRHVAESELVPADVVAIEYYPDFKTVPKIYERLAWPDGPEPCRLIIYWLRTATRPRPKVQSDRPAGLPKGATRRPPAQLR